MPVKPPLYVIRVYSDRENHVFEDVPFAPGKFLMSETIAIEEQANLTWPQVIAGVGAFRVSALRAVIWIMRKRANPKLKIAGVELNIEDLELLDPDVMPEYGYVSPDDLEPEAALDTPEPEAPKDLSSTEPAPPIPSTPEPREE